MSAHVRPKPDATTEAHRQAIIKSLCELQSLVANQVHKYRYAADCFCRQGWHPEPVTSSWRNDEKSLDFIVQSVVEAVARCNNVDERLVHNQLAEIRKGTDE